MRQARRLAPGIAGLLVAGCAGSGPIARAPSPPAPTGPPGIVVVLRDVSPPSLRARFDVAGAAAVRDDGSRVELGTVAPSQEADPPQETVWILGAVPAGAYAAIEVSFRSASGGAASNPTELEVPAAPTRLDVAFVVADDAGTVIEAELRSSLATDSSGRFEPVFDARPRSRPAAGLLGIATVGAWDGAALFDKRTGALASVVPVGRGPTGLAVDSVRFRAYAAASADDAVAVLDLLEGRLRERVSLRAGDAPRDLALTPDGRTLVVANPGSDTIAFVDPLSATEIDRIPVQGRPSALLLDREGRRVFVLAERSSTITVVSVASRSIVGAVSVESGPVRARLAGRDGRTIVVAHADSPYLAVVDATTLAVTGRVYVGLGARALEVDPRSGRIFLARAKTGRVEVFEAASFLPVEEFDVPGEVAWLSVEPEGNGLGILLRSPAEARIVGIVGSGHVARTPLGREPATLRFVQGSGAP